MTDRITQEQRSWNMSRIRSRNSKPEKTVRSLLHRGGYRFRLHVRYLPGTPDIVLPRYRTVIFVHGCFWHQHPGCKHAHTPRSRVAYWEEKLRRNVERHEKVSGQLECLGWRVLTVWECEVSSLHSSAKLKLIPLPCNAKGSAGPRRDLVLAGHPNLGHNSS